MNDGEMAELGSGSLPSVEEVRTDAAATTTSSKHNNNNFNVIRPTVKCGRQKIFLIFAAFVVVAVVFASIAFTRDKRSSTSTSAIASTSSTTNTDTGDDQQQQTTVVVSDPQASYLMTITSNAFINGNEIPQEYTVDGLTGGLSPPLSWSNIPVGTESLVLICEDPDAPSQNNPAEKPFVHWVVYNINPQSMSTGLQEGVSLSSDNNDSSFQEGINSFGTKGYKGPSPPRGSGRHRYYFRLYAIDSIIDDGDEDVETTKDIIMGQVEKQHTVIIANAELMGTYERN